MFAEIQPVPKSRGLVVTDVGSERCPSIGDVTPEPWTAGDGYSTLNGCGSYGQKMGRFGWSVIGMDDAVNYRALARELVGDRSKWP